MSGRDLRNFITQYRSNEQDSMVIRMKEGTGRNQNYRPVDYEELTKKIAQHRRKGGDNLKNVRSIKKRCFRSQNSSLVKMHRKIWIAEYARLAEQEDQLNRDMQLFRSEMHPITRECLGDFETRLKDDIINFENYTLDPVHETRKEIKYKIEQKRFEDSEECLDMINSIITQQQFLLDQMSSQQKQLEIDIRECSNEYDLSISGLSTRNHGNGVAAAEASLLDCPDDCLRRNALAEFTLLDDKYSDRLNGLEADYADTSSVTSDWTDDECFLFQHVYEQYGPETVNRRTLIVDRMLRQLPHKSRHHIV